MTRCCGVAYLSSSELLSAPGVGELKRESLGSFWSAQLQEAGTRWRSLTGGKGSSYGALLAERVREHLRKSGGHPQKRLLLGDELQVLFLCVACGAVPPPARQ